MISEALSGLAAAIIGPGEPRAARVTEDGLGMVEYIMEVPHALPLLHAGHLRARLLLSPAVPTLPCCTLPLSDV